MIKRKLIIPALIIIFCLPVTAQEKKQETGLKREVTLYNPYNPTLPEVKKRSFLPEMTDTMRVKTDLINYHVSAKPFLPVYSISPIKAASLLPDPLPKLYKSYVNAGMGNYLTPLAEISITNERSKKGAVGFYGRHFSSNGKIKLDNDQKVFAGYMDNDASLFGRKFFKKNLLAGSLDFQQKVRYAYGYDPSITDYYPEKSDIRMRYNNIGANTSFSSITLDSSKFYYDFDVSYNYFSHTSDMYQHNFGLDGIMAKSFQGYYVGSGISYDLYKNSDSLSASADYIFSLSPFMRKGTDIWNFKLGFQVLIDKSSVLHMYPDFNFGFSVVPSYVSFFAELTGKMEQNTPLKVISENPYLISNQFPDFVDNGILFRLPDTDHKMIVSAGLKGNTGLGGNYLVSATYSMISDMLFYTNIEYLPVLDGPAARGNYFLPIADDGELLNLHGEMSGPINDKLSFTGLANIYNYNVGIEYPWNKPSWDGKLALKYNLRDKIIAGMELTAQGKRRLIVNGDYLSQIAGAGHSSIMSEVPASLNLNMNAEYRYSRILSLWAKFNNISYKRYYEWAYYPSQRFQFMLGFTYSL